ncbi:glycosyltransferase [Pseudomonadota bacterium]
MVSTQVELVDQARQAVTDGDWHSAKQLWLRCIAQFGTGEQPWWDANLGRALMELGKFTEAEETLLRLRRQFPDYPPGHLHLATLRHRQNQIFEASELWKFCIDKFPHEAQPGWHLNFANALRSGGDIVRAKAVLESVIRNYPDFLPGYTVFSTIASQNQDWEQAYQGWGSCLQLFDDGNQAEWHVNYVEAALKIGKRNQAESSFAILADKFPDFVPGLLLLAEDYFQSGKFDDADQLWKKCAHFEPNEDKRQVKHVRNLIEQKSYKQAESLVVRLMNNGYATAGLYSASALIWMRQHKWEVAEKTWQFCFENFKTEITNGWICSYGITLLNLEQYDEAESLYRRNLDISPDNIDALIGLAKTQYEKRNYTGCLETSMDLQKLEPEIQEGYRLAQEALIKLGRFREAADMHVLGWQSKSVPLTSTDRPDNLPEELVIPPIKNFGNDYSFVEAQLDKVKSHAYSLKASVIVPVYNRVEMLSKTLAALANQTYPKSLFEVIIADDGSSDDPQSLVEIFAPYISIKSVKQRDSGYRLSAVRNLGIQAASHEYIVLLDCDVVPAKEYVESFMRYFHVSDQIALFGLRRFVCIDSYTYQDILYNPDIATTFPDD